MSESTGEGGPPKPDWMQLTDNEQLLWSGHQSLWSFAPSLVSGILLAAIGVGVLIANPSLPAFVPISVVGIAGITVVGALLLTAGMYLEYRMHLYAVTTEQVYHRSGIVSRNIERVRMEQIQNTACSQGILERLLSFGTVQLDTAGTANIELNLWAIKNPRSVSRIVTEQLNERSRSGSMSNAEQQPA
jgi:membrane protein YdbS with pleckstrin-like domain